VDVARLRELLDQKLMERQARESGICPVREELFSQCFDEIIRQVTLSEPERGNFDFIFEFRTIAPQS
jgi:dynein light intermediate chain